MTDQRFFRRAGPFRLGDIARHVGGELSDPETRTMEIADIASLDMAGGDEISVFTGASYRAFFLETHAGAVITTRELAAKSPGQTMIYVAHPRLAYAQIGLLFYPAEIIEPLIDPRAVVDSTAVIGAGARIEAGAVIGPGAEVGPRSHVGHNAVLGAGVVVGTDCSIGPNCSISHAIIGNAVRISGNVTIGSEGFGFVAGPVGLMRMRQLGRVIISDRVEIGANCAIDRGATGDTAIGAGTVLDNLVQIGHNVRLGRNCILSGQVGVAGSTVLGDGVVVGGQTAISDHLRVGSGARIAGKSGVLRDIEPGGVVAGYPAMPVRQWHRQTISLARLAGQNGRRPQAAARPPVNGATEGVDE